MSAQILELLILAAVAFFIINKLISSLGITSDDDPAKNSYFGEPGQVKDITLTEADRSNDNSIAKRFFNKTTKDMIDLTNIIYSEADKEKVTTEITQLSIKMPSFKIDNFIKGARGAFKLIIESKNVPAQLKALVDKRFIDKFAKMSDSYGKLSGGEADLKISDIYSFGNSIFIKLIISGHNIIDNVDDFKEEWTFSKNINDNSLGWHLNNVERLLV